MLWVSSTISGGALRIWKLEALFKFIFLLSTAERKRQRDRGMDRGKKTREREREGLLSCCVVPCDCEGAAPPRLTAILLPPASSSSPPSSQSLLWPVSGKCPCSWHTHAHFKTLNCWQNASASPQNSNIAHKLQNYRYPSVSKFKLGRQPEWLIH